jgi:SAM-dependent methyltransferase
MSFEVAPEAYYAFIGRYSEPLAVKFAAALQIRPGQRVLDVGCGPGALTAVLAERSGSDSVSALDPSESFVSAIHRRLPGVDARRGVAAELPFADGQFDVTAAQLVIPFMPDPDAGIREMARVTAPGGTVAACVWDHAGRRSPLAVFWQAVHDVDPGARDEADRPGARDGHLVELFSHAGLREAAQTTLTVTATHTDFDAWWHPYTLGAGPAGAYVATLDPAQLERVRARCRELLPPGEPFTISATAWTVLAHA